MHLATDNLAAEPTPYFLLRLDLGPDTDARAIRRAYARELKLIDQEADLPAFQTLRECYEVALRWAAYQAQRQQGKTAPPDLVPETVPVDPEALALVVYQRFLGAHDKLVAGRIMDDVSLWEAELRLRLADDELINLSARATFEARVAHLLAGPWQAANGALFSAAASVFDWNEDRRRLRQFGYAGAFLNQALEERKLFDAQAVADLAYQRKILARLRSPGQPEINKVQNDMPSVERMVVRFPTFLALQVCQEAVDKWRAMAKSGVQDLTPEPVLEGDTSRRGFDKAWIFFLLVGIATLLRMYAAHNVPGSSPFPIGDPFGRGKLPSHASERPIAPGERPLLSHAPLDQKLVDAIGRDIHYQYRRDAPLGQRMVKYEVFLDADGKVLGMNKLMKSMDSEYDLAVAAAIKRARPFPPEAGTRFVLRYAFTLTGAPAQRTWKAQPREPFQPAAALGDGAAAAE